MKKREVTLKDMEAIKELALDNAALKCDNQDLISGIISDDRVLGQVRILISNLMVLMPTHADCVSLGGLKGAIDEVSYKLLKDEAEVEHFNVWKD